MDHSQQSSTYADGTTGDGLLPYSQGFFSHTNDHNDAGWDVHAGTFSHPTSSRTSYQPTDWAAQQPADHLSVPSLDPQHAHAQLDTFRRSPLPTNAAFSPAATFNNYGGHATYHYQQPQYDPLLLPSTSQAFKQYQTAYTGHNIESRTIQPKALEHEAIYQGQNEQKQPVLPNAATVSRAANIVDQVALARAVPLGKANGIFHTIDFDRLIRATNSERMTAFSTVAREPQEWDVNRAALPTYVPRQSKNALKRLAGQDGALLAKINQKSVKKARILKPATSRSVKCVGNTTSNLGIKSERQEQLDDSAESDDSSEYTSDSDIEDSPLPSRRPDTPKEAIEYDTIKAVWRSKRRAVDANDVRKGLVDFWELVKTVRDRWKTDASAVIQAEEKKLKGELPLLRQRVKDQRDMIDSAFRAALKHGNRTILETLSENASLLFLCYQFLLDRFKAEDVNGPLARSILEVMVLFNTLDNSKLEKTYLAKVLPRYAKSGDAKTQYYAKSIISKATGNSNSVVSETKSAQSQPDALKSESVSGVKRPANGTEAGPAAKKTATFAARAQANTTTTGSAKKRLLGDDASKPAAKKSATSNGVVPKPVAADTTAAKSKTAASKLTTGLFAGLQSAAKKPGTSVKSSTAPASSNVAKTPVVTPTTTAAPARSVFSFAETMKNLTQPKEEKPAPKIAEKDITSETPDQKARRLRREARGPLRVHWKSNEDLLEIREFTHDPDEERGHDSSQTRDVADLRGEGRMFKQQHNKILYEDDDEPTVEVPVKMVDWYEPLAVDFSEVPADERDRNYYPFGGGQRQPESAENVERKKYEDTTLMVFYSHSDDIPATPREPEEPITGEPETIRAFAAQDQKYLDRAAQTSRQRRGVHPGLQGPRPPIDFDSLRSALGMQHAGASYQTPQISAPVSQPVFDIQAIIAQLGQKGPPQQPVQAPQPAPFMPQPAFSAPNPLAAFFPTVPQPAVAPSGQPEISAILAQLGQPAQPAGLPPSIPGFPPPNVDPGFLAFLAQHQQQQALGMNGGSDASTKWSDQGRGASGNDGKEKAGYKTKVCKYWQEGTCMKGDNCSYRHA